MCTRPAPRGCDSRGTGHCEGAEGRHSQAGSPRRPLSKPGFQESPGRNGRAAWRSTRAVWVRDAWHLFTAGLLGKQIVFMSERKDPVSGQSLQLVRSDQRPQPHMPGQGASAPLGPAAEPHQRVAEPQGAPSRGRVMASPHPRNSPESRSQVPGAPAPAGPSAGWWAGWTGRGSRGGGGGAQGRRLCPRGSRDSPWPQEDPGGRSKGQGGDPR